MDVLDLFADCIWNLPVTLPACLSSVTFPICLSATQKEIALNESYWLCLEKSEFNPQLCPRISGWCPDNFKIAPVKASQAALCQPTHWREGKHHFCGCFDLLSFQRTQFMLFLRLLTNAAESNLHRRLQVFLYCKWLCHKAMESICFLCILHVDCGWGIFNLAVLAAWSKSVGKFGRGPHATPRPWSSLPHLWGTIPLVLECSQPQRCKWGFKMKRNQNIWKH